MEAGTGPFVAVAEGLYFEGRHGSVKTWWCGSSSADRQDFGDLRLCNWCLCWMPL